MVRAMSRILAPGSRDQASLDLATSHDITPHRCYRCKGRDNWSRPNYDVSGHDKNTGDLIWQCNHCGQYNTLTRATIAAKARRAALRPWV